MLGGEGLPPTVRFGGQALQAHHPSQLPCSLLCVRCSPFTQPFPQFGPAYGGRDSPRRSPPKGVLRTSDIPTSEVSALIARNQLTSVGMELGVLRLRPKDGLRSTTRRADRDFRLHFVSADKPFRRTTRSFLVQRFLFDVRCSPWSGNPPAVPVKPQEMLLDSP